MNAVVPALAEDRPFPGLRPFTYANHAYFFGRTDQIYALYRMLDRSRFVAVVGSSGSGKSSLVFAGLRPLLDKESREPGGRHWVWREMAPGDNPLNRLIDLVHGLAKEASDDLGGEGAFAASHRDRISYLIRLSRRGLVDALGEIQGLKEKTLVLVIDQFEELFRYATSSQVRDRAKELLWREEAVLFVELLLEASRSPSSNARIMLTMRSDFIGDCARFHGLPEAVSETQFLVPLPARDQREEIIRGPIMKAGGSIDPMLVERLLNDASDDLDQLPVLQHCLSRLWDQAAPLPNDGATGGRHLTLDHYKQIGEMSGALSQHANKILDELPGLESVAEQVFRALSEIDREGRATRRALVFAQLLSETGVVEADLRTVIDRFRSDDCSFLLPSHSKTPELKPDTRIDVGHEALLRRWERVCGEIGATGAPGDMRPIGWLREEQKDGLRYQALLSIVDSDASDRPTLPLDQVERYWTWWTQRPRTEAWTNRYGGGFDRVKQLLDDSRAALKVEAARRKADETGRRRARITQVAAVSLSVILLVVAISAYSIYGQYQSAQEQRDLAERNSRAALNSVNKVVSQVLEALNYGQMTAHRAKSMLDDAQKAIDAVSEAIPTSETTSLKINVLLMISDTMSTLGDDNKALDRAKQARDLAEQFSEREPSNPKWPRLVYASLFRIGDAATSSSFSDATLKEALTSFLKAQEIALQSLNGAKEDGNRIYDLAFVNNKVGETLQGLGDFHGAIEQFRAALELAKAISDRVAGTPEWRAIFPSTLTKIGRALATRKPNPDLDAALEQYSEALKIQTELETRYSANHIVRSNLALTHRHMGDVFMQRSETNKAIVAFTSTVSILESLHREDSSKTGWFTVLAPAYARLGEALESVDPNRALAQLEKEVAIRQELLKKYSTNEMLQQRLADSERRLADLKARIQASIPLPGDDEKKH